MQNIIKDPPEFDRLSKCIASLQFAFLFLLLILMVKEAVNFYRKNYIPFMLIQTEDKKYEQNTAVTLDYKTGLVKTRDGLSPTEEVNNSLKQNGSRNIKVAEIELNVENGSKVKTSQISKKSMGKTENFIKQGRPELQKIQMQTQVRSKTANFQINLHIENFFQKLPLLAIMVINIILLTSFEFLVILGYIGIIVMLVGEFVHKKWAKIGLAMEILSIAIVIAGWVNGYATGRNVPIGG